MVSLCFTNVELSAWELKDLWKALGWVSPPPLSELAWPCENDSECDYGDRNKCCESERTDIGKECKNVSVCPENRSDLSGKSLSANYNGCFLLGEPVTLHATIANKGYNDVTKPFTVSFYISGNNIFGDGDDLLLGYYQHTGIIHGSRLSNENSSSFTVTLPTQKLFHDTYFNDNVNYIGMKIDSGNQIDETNEENNGPRYIPSYEEADRWCEGDCVKVRNPFIFPLDATMTEGRDERDPHRDKILKFRWDIKSYCKPNGNPIRIDYSTENGSAIAGIDYEQKSGTKYCYESSCSIWVPIMGDTQKENDEYFYLYFTLENVHLANPNSFYEDYHHERYRVKGHIINDDISIGGRGIFPRPLPDTKKVSESE